MKTLVKPKISSLKKRMASDKVVIESREWSVNPYTKRGKWTSKKETGILRGYNPSTKNYDIQMPDGSIVQRTNFLYYKKAKR